MEQILIQKIQNKNLNFDMTTRINQYFTNTDTIKKKIDLIQYNQNIENITINTQDIVDNINSLTNDLVEDAMEFCGIHKSIIYIPCFMLLKELEIKIKNQQFSIEQHKEYENFVDIIEKEIEFGLYLLRILSNKERTPFVA